MEGDLSKEDEERLIEELENARDEIKNMKMRQAMVTHELLGTIKGANAEVDILKAALADMTAQRDARVDISTLAGKGSSMSGAEAEEFQALKVMMMNEFERDDRWHVCQSVSFMQHWSACCLCLASFPKNKEPK